MEFNYHFNNLYTVPKICDKFSIFQVGELLANKDTVVMNHYQCCYEITFVISGKGESVTDRVKTPIGPDDCYISFPNEWHNINSDKDNPLKYRFVGFSSKDPTILPLLLKLKTIFNSTKNRVIKCPQCKELFLKLLNEMGQTEYDDLLIGAVMTEILVTILRQHSQSSQNYVSPKITSKSLLVYHVSFYIENNILKLTNLNSLTEVFHYTYQYITRVFYEITGVKLHNFFLNEKIKTAKHFLESSDYTVTEISALLNYSCTHAFTRMFKEQTGKTPKQYQKEFKSQPRFSEEDI